ncbi:MAG: Uma2 family endonuclease [Akkermansiaceae bacterium]|nr:Uma2 family endonuclease [Armatimonadota bacterium]
MTAEKFWQFAKDNEQIKIEMTMDGELIVYSPTGGGGSGYSNNNLLYEITAWARQDGSGVVFDSSTLFVLPNGAKRSPDAAWVTKSRWDALSDEEKEKPVPFAPDFAAEILSPTDSLTETQAKMEEYRTNGVRLGWLIDRKARKVYVYRPGTTAPETLDDPATVSGASELPGFVLDTSQVFVPRSP